VYYPCGLGTSYSIPQGVQTIGDYAFSGCKTLESIDIPSTVHTIGSYAFSGCNELKNIPTYDGLLVIETGAFNGCISIETVIFPESLIAINGSAFSNCVNLKRVEYYGVYDPLYGTDAMFDGCTQLDHIYVTYKYMDDSLDVIENLIRCGIITSTGEVDGRWFIENGTLVCDIAELKPYFDPNTYVIGNLRNNELVNSKSVVLQDMDLIVKKKKIAVVIDMDENNEHVNSSEMAEMISQATGINVKELIVEVTTNEQGQIIRIVVYVDDEQSANSIKTMAEECRGH